MKRMTLSEYLAVPENYRGVWTTERWDIPDWENLRKSHMGKRTLMVYDKGTCLLVEGLSLEIVDDSSWKKPEEIKKEIREKYQEYRTEKGHEPAFPRMRHTLERHLGDTGDKNRPGHGFRYGNGR